ncbi:MAG: hypothetical protein HYX93_05330 [Chloroflexi bacterium]|nr:hypothetical protein [Chloroflexota bacterium]
MDQEEYDAVVAERDSALASAGTLETQLQAGTAERDSLTSQLRADLQQAQSSVNLLEANVATLELSKASLQGQLAAVQGDLQELQSKFPLRPFSNRNELEVWLASDTVSEQPDTQFAADWYANALEIQKRAADDGFIVSAEFLANGDVTWTVWNSTVIENGNYYWWNPEEDLLTLELNVESWR